MTTTNNITTSTVTINNYPSTYIPTKVCNKCRTIKQLTEFYKDKAKHDGYHSQCKICTNIRRREYYNENKNDILKNRQEYYKTNKIQILEYKKENKDEIANRRKEYYEQNKHKISEYNKEYYELNKDRIDKYNREYSKEYYKQHKDKCNKYQRNYETNQRQINPIFRLIKNNRRRISHALQSNNKADHSINLLGCTKEFFYNFIKFQLPYEMDDNEFKENYHIDHVVALANFDLSIPENQFIAFSWQNCAPLLKQKNFSKGARRDLWSEVMQDLKITVFLKLYYPDEC